MQKMKFVRKVAVHRGAALYYQTPAAAEHLLNAGLATVRQKTARVISAIELTSLAVGYIQGQVAANKLGLRPGSFGIRVESFPSGVFCFDHRNPWHEVAA